MYLRERGEKDSRSQALRESRCPDRGNRARNKLSRVVSKSLGMRDILKLCAPARVRRSDTKHTFYAQPGSRKQRKCLPLASHSLYRIIPGGSGCDQQARQGETITALDYRVTDIAEDCTEFEGIHSRAGSVTSEV